MEKGAVAKTMLEDIFESCHTSWIAEEYCHTRSNLEIPALLEILQTFKLDHNMAVKCTWDHPPGHPPLA